MKKLILLSFSLLLLLACESTKNLSNQNLADIYQKEEGGINPEYIVIHLNDSISRIHYRIDSREILYSKKQNELEFTAKLKFYCQLTASFEGTQILDSVSVYLEDENPDLEEKMLTGVIDVKARSGNNYLLQIDLEDLKKKTSATKYREINKTRKNGRQSFIVKRNNQLIYDENLISLAPLTVSQTNKKVQQFYVRYYKQNYSIALPPFSLAPQTSIAFTADSTFTISANQGTAIFIPRNYGFYHIQTDTLSKEGLTLYFHYKDFPKVYKTEQLAEPLRYISTRQEFEAIIKGENKKAEIDKFWLNCAGNKERAKELIKKYYNRVQDANTYFSSFLPGWKSDRGMIYLIYGPPNIIYKKVNGETWVYGEENNLMSLSFSFTKLGNPFTDNDYQLERSSVYKNSWYRAVDIWRQGRIY